ncbi:MAG TPA: phenylalanine--tRNA ligase subunit beta, partial [Candidatus Avacidaminococcus intestinavium]|nr:phenylalanine--tRNA ligase subunit beta [Candidatus Avacidaminococcus intestinavium]
YDFNQAVYVLELELEALTAPALLIPQYKHLPKFPGMTRDLAVVVPRDVTMQDLEKVIKENAGPLLQNITVFDIYTGKQIGEGHKSMAFNLTLQAQDRTLTDNEADLIIKKVVNAIQETFAAKLRD